ncbi:MAG: hypothetical protein CME64_10995 [Halobacteriovoraceae bacterium]|nr:hypothetical protein [Halobacteriovoraceae bacterium]|tara:strand:- start:127975 stop:128697 length:723 start_codon:yes stop_codon:yes gene_type:complete
MIQKPSKELTLIVYNTPKPPKYIKLNKGLLKLLVFAIPFLLIVSLLFSFTTSVVMKRKLEQAKSKEPRIITSLKEDKAKLESELAQLKAVNTELTNKISQGSSSAPASALALFSTPVGYEDVTELEKAKLENMSANFKQKKAEFRFDLLNNLDNDEKLAGYISIVQFSDNQMSFHPQRSLSLENNKLDFSKGESFVVSRFRPVIAEFEKPSGLSVWYKVFIFSRSGDLISYKVAGPYQVN